MFKTEYDVVDNITSCAEIGLQMGLQMAGTLVADSHVESDLRMLKIFT